MAFKYLYCCEDATDYDNYFRYCHVPLDSVTLEWFCRECRNREVSIKTGNISKWSTIDVYGDETTDECAAGNKKFYTYMFFQKHFREWFALELTPLQTEFTTPSLRRRGKMGKYRVKWANISRFCPIFFEFENFFRKNYALQNRDYAPDWCIFSCTKGS